MEKDIMEGSNNQLPEEGSQVQKPSQKFTWLTDLVKAMLSPFLKRGKRKRKFKYRRTEVNKDGYVQQEFTYKEEHSDR